MGDLKGQRLVLTNNLAKHVGDNTEPCGYWKRRWCNSPMHCFTPELKMQRVIGFSTSCEHCAREQGNSGESCDNPRIASPTTEDSVVVGNFEEEYGESYDEDGAQKSMSNSAKGGTPPSVQDEHGELFSPFSNDTTICDMVTEDVQGNSHKCSFGHAPMHTYKSSMERVPSRLTAELLEKASFENKMSRLKNLNIKSSKIDVIDYTPTHSDDNGDLVRTLSCRVPGELSRTDNGYAWAKKVTRSSQRKARHHHPVMAMQTSDVSPNGSSCSEAMPIPRMTRAQTTPDPLPELSASLLDTIMKSKESPKTNSEMKPKIHERRRSPKGVPSAEFLQNIAALKDLQDNVFENPSHHHHLAGESDGQKHGLYRRYSSRFRDI